MWAPFSSTPKAYLIGASYPQLAGRLVPMWAWAATWILSNVLITPDSINLIPRSQTFAPQDHPPAPMIALLTSLAQGEKVGWDISMMMSEPQAPASLAPLYIYSCSQCFFFFLCDRRFSYGYFAPSPLTSTRACTSSTTSIGALACWHGT